MTELSGHMLIFRPSPGYWECLLCFATYEGIEDIDDYFCTGKRSLTSLCRSLNCKAELCEALDGIGAVLCLRCSRAR